MNAHDLYCRHVNAAILKKKFRFKKQAINWIAVIERANELEPYHYHGLLDRPSRLGLQQFKELLTLHWQYGQIDVRDEDQGNWLHYMTKIKTKEINQHYNYSDSILENSLILDNKIPRSPYSYT